MELYGFMEREKKIPSYFFIITKRLDTASCAPALLVAKTDITVSIAKPVVINLFDIIILII